MGIWKSAQHHQGNANQNRNEIFPYLLKNKWKKVKVKLLSRVQLLATPWIGAYQSPLSMGFSRQEYWSRLLFPSPGDLPDPGIEPRSPHIAGRCFTLWATTLKKIRDVGMWEGDLVNYGGMNTHIMVQPLWKSVWRCLKRLKISEFGGEWTPVYLRLSHLDFHLKLSQHRLLTCYTPIQIKSLKFFKTISNINY